MSEQGQASSDAGATLKENLLQLSAAEELVCKVLQLSADTCAELEKLPFSDQEQLQSLSSEMIAALQSIRANIVNSVDSIQPIEAQQIPSGAGDETTTILAALDSFR